MDHHRREAQQRIQSRTFRGCRAGGRKRRGVEDHQRDEERAEAEQYGGRITGHVAQPPAHQEQSQARPQRQQPRPQQQRSFLRGPHGRRPVEGRRRAARRVGDCVEGEVVAQECELEHSEGDGEDARERVDRAPSRVCELHASAAHAIDRSDDPVGADRQRQHQAAASERCHHHLPPPRGRSGGRAGTQ